MSTKPWEVQKLLSKSITNQNKDKKETIEEVAEKFKKPPKIVNAKIENWIFKRLLFASVFYIYIDYFYIFMLYYLYITSRRKNYARSKKKIILF